MTEEELTKEVIKFGRAYIGSSIAFEEVRELHKGRKPSQQDLWLYTRFEKQKSFFLARRPDISRFVTDLRAKGLLRYKDIGAHRLHSNPVTLTEEGLTYIRRLIRKNKDFDTYIQRLLHRENTDFVFRGLWKTNFPTPKIAHWTLMELLHRDVVAERVPGIHTRYWLLNKGYGRYDAPYGWYTTKAAVAAGLKICLTDEGYKYIQAMIPHLSLQPYAVKMLKDQSFAVADYESPSDFLELLLPGVDLNA